MLTAVSVDEEIKLGPVVISDTAEVASREAECHVRSTAARIATAC